MQYGDWSLIKTIEAERDAIASAKTETEHNIAKKIQDLVKIKCIGPEFLTALVSEVFYRSFDNRQQLAGYVGLTPSHFQSGAIFGHCGWTFGRPLHDAAWRRIYRSNRFYGRARAGSQGRVMIKSDFNWKVSKRD